ncbi:MAG: hypothetical protein AB7P03_02610 [Kofleriaceae bacterium]
MTTCPIPHDRLVRYWAHDLAEHDVDEIDDHLFSCRGCFEAAGQVAALAKAIRHGICPIPDAHDVALARARGLRVETNDFAVGEAKEVWFHKGTDLLVHRLHVPELARYQKLAVRLVAADGAPIIEFDDAPIDRSSGVVLIACQAHFATLLPAFDCTIQVRGTDATGAMFTDSFTVIHRFE